MISPHSPWYARRQKLSEFHFTERVKEVPSLVLQSKEVTEGIKLVKGLPNSEGAIIKDYSSDYKEVVMTDMNAQDIIAIVLNKKSVAFGFQYMVGLRVHGDNAGALHSGYLLQGCSGVFYALGITETTDLNAQDGNQLVLSIDKVQRIMRNGKVTYNATGIHVKRVEPPGSGSSMGDLDNSVGETLEEKSKFNFRDLVYSEAMKEGKLIGEVVDFVTAGSLLDYQIEVTGAGILWENGEMTSEDFSNILHINDRFSEERILKAKENIRENMVSIFNASGDTTTGTTGIDGVQDQERLAGKEPKPNQKFITTTTNGHFHTWSPGASSTSVAHGHKHSIDIDKGTALETDGHIHKLTLQSAE